MPKTKRLRILLCLLMIQAIIPHAGAAAPGTEVRIEPADSAAGLNESFVVQVVIEEASDLGGFQFDLVYDPSIVQVTEVMLGDFLESTGNSAVAIGPEVNNAEGKVTFGAVSFGTADGASGTGVLATLTCVAHGEGSTALALREVQVLDTLASTQQITVEGGRVVVRDAAAPTPTTAATSTPAATATSAPPPTATPAPTGTDTPAPPPTATSAPAATATPAPSLTATASPPATATAMPTNTPEAAETLTPAATALPSPTATATPPPAPTLTASTAPTETQPAEVTSVLPSPTVEPSQTPAAATTAPSSPAATSPPSPSPTPIPSATPLATISVSAAKGPSSSVVLGLVLAALVAASLAVFILRRRSGG